MAEEPLFGDVAPPPRRLNRCGRTMLEPHVSEALRRSGHRIVITGAGGWLGRATLDLLRESLGSEFDSRVCCFGSKQRTMELSNGAAVEQQPLGQLGSLQAQPTILLHLAFLTKDRAEAMDEEDYRATNRQISTIVLGALDAIGAEGVFVASSGAAAFADDSGASPAMRLYGQLKRDDEVAFSAWAERSGRTAVIARIFNLSGPYINKHGSYALASFILDALSGGPIVVKASNEVRRGYVAIRELMSLAFAMLLEGGPGAALFETGGEPMEMGEIAEAVAAELGDCGVERSRFAAGPADTYVGDHEAYASLLKQYRVEPVPFARQVAETAKYLANRRQCPIMTRKTYA